MEKYDPLFAKSCARLIDNCIKLEKQQPTENMDHLRKANKYGQKYSQFTKETQRTTNTDILKILESTNIELNFEVKYNSYKIYFRVIEINLMNLKSSTKNLKQLKAEAIWYII